MKHTCTRHKPGATCYRLCACRCDDCRTGRRQYAKRYAFDAAKGDRRRIPSGIVRVHIERCLETMSMTDIALRSNYGRSELLDILRGDQPTIRRACARRILAVSPGVRIERGFVHPAVVRRRMQALMACGWSLAEMSSRAGMSSRWASDILNSPRPTARTAEAIRGLYEALWDKAPTGPVIGITKARDRAARNGWAPPAAWDDGAGPHGIDNPDATPHDDAPAEWRGGTRLEDVLWLAEAGTPVAAICERLGCTDKDIRDALRRAGRPRLWQAIRVDPLTDYAAMGARSSRDGGRWAL